MIFLIRFCRINTKTGPRNIISKYHHTNSLIISLRQIKMAKIKCDRCKSETIDENLYLVDFKDSDDEIICNICISKIMIENPTYIVKIGKFPVISEKDFMDIMNQCKKVFVQFRLSEENFDRFDYINKVELEEHIKNTLEYYNNQ